MKMLTEKSNKSKNRIAVLLPVKERIERLVKTESSLRLLYSLRGISNKKYNTQREIEREERSRSSVMHVRTLSTQLRHTRALTAVCA